MARYTIELRTIITFYGREAVKKWFTDWKLSDYLTADEINTINQRGTFDQNKLADLIIDHYYMREIGFETIDYFARRAKIAMREIMEEKAPLIYSAAIKYDPLVNVDFTETFDHTMNGNGQSNSSSNTNGSGLTINSDTPQGQINKQAILNGSYASSTQGNETSGTVTDQSNSSTDNTEHYTKKTKGNSGISATAQKMIQQYRDNIIMINRDIVEALSTLFMGVY